MANDNFILLKSTQCQYLNQTRLPRDCLTILDNIILKILASCYKNMDSFTFIKKNIYFKFNSYSLTLTESRLSAKKNLKILNNCNVHFNITTET